MKNRTPMAFPNKTPNRTPNKTAVTIGLTGLAVTIALCLHAGASSQQSTPPQAAPPVAVAQSSPSPGAAPPGSSQRRVLDRYCVTCHNQKLKTAGLMLDEADVSNPGAGAEVWEKVVRKLRTGTMPPPSMPQPPVEDRRALLIVAGNVARPDRRREAESGPHGDVAASQSHRVSERHQRSAGPRHRRHLRSCPPMKAVTASTTSRSATCPRLCWTDTSPLRRRSAGWRLAPPRRPCRATSSASRPTSRRKTMYLDSRSARVAGFRPVTRSCRTASTTSRSCSRAAIPGTSRACGTRNRTRSSSCSTGRRSGR